ncbi:hypothetical protein [Clostridium saccharoperbutylacetonicum]|uniref:hypothetical protein n=1 Tax=Clostridium saccharoperbutylacetonicum TaxID=36745 RepID=UPI0039ED1CDD
MAVGIAKEKNIDIKLIAVDDLIRDEDNQANDIFKRNILNELKEIILTEPFEQKLYEAEKIKYNYTN